MEGEDQERKRKVEAGKAKLAQFRQRKGQSDSQNSSKKSKKKKSSPGSKYREQPEHAPDASLSQSDEAPSQSATSGAAATAEFTIMRTVPHGEIIKHDQTYTIEPESEISTTADDYSSEVMSDNFLLTANPASDLEREEEFGVRETFSEHGTQSSQTRLEVMEDELAGKQQEIEELNRELEEMRAAYGTEGLQQLQEFEMAVKQRDGIITQLTTNLQQARREKDDIMREFLELTEQSQNLKIQFQHLQASETKRNTSRTSTAADLFQSKQHIFTYQQQLEEQGQRLKHYQKENEGLQFQIVALQEEIKNMQQVHHKELEASYEKKLTEKDLTVNGLKSALIDEEKKSFQLQERIAGADRSLDELREQLTLKSQEISSLTEELNHSKQKERRSSEEIKQLMGTVEDLQKKHHKGTQSEADIIHRMELETQRKLEQLQAELDEMYGQQIVQMKQELFKQHTLEIEKLVAEHKAVVDNLSNQTETNAQIHSLSTAIGELNSQLQHSNEQRTKMKEDFDQKLEAVSSEKTLLQRQIEDLLQDLSFAREQIHRAKQSISEKDSKLNETSSLHITIENLRAELASATEFTKEMEIKHEAEVTNYKIKLEMLEREKDAVLDRMAESQEAELEKLRTHFLFSQEDDMSKLREDLTREHRTNIENLKDNLEVQYNQQIDQLQHEMGQTIRDLQSEKDNLITAQNCLTMEISKLTDLLQSVNDPKSEAMMARINELQTELDFLRKEREKGSVEQDVEELQRRITFLENELEDKNTLIDRVAALESDNTLLKDENNALQNSLKKVNIDGHERGLVDRTDSDYHVLKKEIEILTAENKRLGNLELQLRNEIERQKNTFSFAEKNFDVNYQELKEEYACLLNIKNQLENNKIKQEEEYQVKLCVLNDELSKFKGNSLESNELSINSLPKLIKADTLEGMDIVEKDTIELMEKLELAQRDKEELSLKVCDLSEQLQFKQNEINKLKDQLKSLHQERDHVLSEGQKLDHVISTRNVNPVQDFTEHPVETDALMSVSDTPNKDKRTLNKMEECEKNVHRNNCAPYLLPDIGELQQENKNAFEILSDSTSRVKHESVLLRNAQQEQYHLQTQIAALQQELADMTLQLEAQRITLNEIHIARLKLLSENLQREKEQELCKLKEEMLRIQEVKLEELQDVHQRNLQSLQLEHPENVTGSDIGSCRVLIEMLMKRIRDEQNHINECFNQKHLENQKKANETEHEGAERLQDSSGGSVEQQHLTEVQSNLATLLDSFLEEYRRVTALYNSLEETHSRPMSADAPESNTLRHIPIPSHSSAPHSTDDSKILDVASSRSEEAEKLKNAFSLQRTQLEDKHSQEIEHLRFYFQQQLKEREERYTTEIIHLQEQLHSVNQTSLDFRVLSESQLVVELGSHEAEMFKSVLAPVTEELKMAFSGPIYQQLHILRQALYGRYVDEVNALKKQHEAELDRLKADLTEKYSLENASLKKEITQLKQAKKDILYETFGELSLYQLSNNEEQKHSDINQLMEERYRERIEEEIARVIVEMTIGFAQKTELARLATLKNGESEISCECAVENSDKLQVKQDNDNDDGKTENLQSVELPAYAQSVESQTLAASDVKNGDTEVQSVIAEQTNEQSPIHQDATATTEMLPTEKTVVLNEQDYNQMVAMGAESAKLRLLYEERVEDMRQELVRLEQERQQAIEALRLAHAAQLERQMYDQEQLLTELHTVRAQLADNVLVFSENQDTERERMLLETLKQTCPETRGKQDFTQQDNSSQTEHEPVKEVENEEEMQEGGEENEESRDSLVSDPICDRNTLKRANKHLLKILLEIAKTTGAVEETIGRHVVGLLDKSGRRQSLSKGLVWSPDPVCAGDVPLTGSVSDFAEEKITPIWSGEEVSELSQQLTGEEFVGIDINPEDEGCMLNIVTRLQGAVEKLLEVINDTSNQLEHAKAAQTELVRESIKRKQETSELLKIQDELQERLNEEAKAREHLALELSKAEGLLDGYTDERVFLEKQMQEKNDLIQHLEQELQSTGNRLQEFEQERQQIQEERELLSRQKNALKADAAPAEQRLVEAAVVAAPKEELLEEAEKLLKEKIEVQRQAEKDSGDFHKQVKVLEIELEEQVTRFTELEQEKNADLEDLRQKNLALEKQLEKTRKFLDEQAVDREHERDVFQQEIQKLEQQLKMPQRYQPTNDQQSNQVETLENNLKEKTDKCSELLLSKEQLQRDVQERNEEIEKLECRIRELEQALLISTDSIQKVEDRRASLIKVVKGEMPLEAQLQVEREAMDRKENEITNLEEQLEQFREELENKIEEVQQLHMQLEIQRKESATQIHGLEQENKTLKDECENLQLDLQGDSTLKTHLLKGEKYEEQLLLKDQEIDQLNEQIVKLQTQLKAATDNKVIEEKNEQIKEYKSQIKCLRSDQERLKKNSEEEIEKLNEVIDKLQEELASIEQKVSADIASMTEDGYNSRHQLDDLLAEKEILQQGIALGETELNLTRAAHVERKAEDLENLRNTKGNVEKETRWESNCASNLELEMQAVLKPLANPSYPYLQDMELQLQELKQIIKEKDSELLQYSDQVKELKEQVQIIEHLNGVIQNLQVKLKEQNISLESSSKTEDAESSKHHLETVRAEKTLAAKVDFDDTMATVSKTDLEATKSELHLLREELKKLKERTEVTVLGNVSSSKNQGIVAEHTEAKFDKPEEALRAKTAQHLANEALLESVQETAQGAMNNMESQLQKLQGIIKQKDSELAQHANQTTTLEKQVQEIEQLNNIIRTLQKDMAEIEQRVSVEFDKKMESLQAENELLKQKAVTNEEAATRARAELEKTQTEVKVLKDKVQNLLTTQENNTTVQECLTICSNDGLISADIKANLENLEDALREKTAQLLASQALYTSMQESMQSVINNMESQLQEFKMIIQVKDSEFLQLEGQKELLNKQTEDIKQLNTAIEILQKELSQARVKDNVQPLRVTQDIECSNQYSRTLMPNHQDSRLNNEEVNLAMLELEETKAKVNVLKEELEKLRTARENALDCTSVGPVMSSVESRTNDGIEIQENLEQKTELLLTNQAWQTTINSMEAELQELQKVIAEKDLELLQYSSEIELLKEQVKTEGDQHGQIMSAMEDTLREKVAAALVSEAQIKAIQVHTKQMQRSDTSSIHDEESKATQTSMSTLTEGEEAESKLSALSLRLLQLEKQLADLHEQLQVEREQVIAANELAAEKERKLRELQTVLESTTGKRESVCTGSPSEREGAVTSQGNVMGDLEQELQRIKAETTATKEELCHYREVAEKLQEELLVKETNVAHLEEDLKNMKKCLSEAEDKLACFMKREEQLAEEKKQSLDVLDGVGVLAQAAFDMTSSSSQTDRASSVNNSNQTPPVHLVDMGIQNELETTQLNSVSDEVREMVEQYTEKIGQMQDLHAAEILDMEARHIAEADSLRREQYVAVQTLTKECESLKSVIGALKAGRTIPDAALSDSYQFTDGASSDTGSDWSQGIYATNSFVSAPDGIRGDDEVLTDLLPNKIKNLLRAVHKEGIQVLSLTESAISEPNLQSLGASSESWMEERKSLIETIRCLKNLIGKMQNEEKSELEEGSEFPDCSPDWRGELLCAIQDVFCREQDVLMAAFHTQLDTLGSCDAATLVTQMEHRLQELGMEQINSMDCIQNADRRSLLLEIQDLRSELCSIQNNGATDQPFHLHIAGDVFTNRVQQDQPQQAQHTHSQLNSLKAKAAELQEQLNSERALVAKINNELAQTKIELESTLKQQHKHFKELESLRIELKQRTDELDGVNDALTSEQKKTRELQWVLEKEKTKVERSEEREKEELEDLKMLVEDQKLKNMELSKLIETETQAVKDLQERIASMELTHNTELSQERNKFLELQTVFEVEKTRSSELANALQCKREMDLQIQLCEQNGQNPPLNPAEDLLKELNAQLENKHKRIVELMSEMESSKLECVQLRKSMEEASKNHQREMQAEQDAARVAHEQAEELKSKVEDLQHRLMENVLEMQKLQADKTYLKETIQELQKNGHEVIDGPVTERRELGDNTERKGLIDQCRTRSQNEKGGGDAQEAGSISLSPVNGDQFSGGSSVSIESIQRRLQQVSSKLKQLATKASQRILFDEADNEDFVLSQNILQEVRSHLELVAVMSLQEKNLVIPGTPTNTLTERLLTQNAELTGYVSRLTEEKNDLRNAVLRLEGEVTRHRLTGASGDHSYRPSVDNAVNVDSVIASERELWNKEKVQLQKSLKHCEAELSKVKAELRSEAAHRDLGRESENSALKRIYGKYLRSESFRKALVYQKKYLLLLLGGFQECEEATLTLIARMGGRPSYTDLAIITNHTRAFTRFRSAVRVSIAISRMKFLVRRWQRATGSSINRNGFGQSSGNELRTDSPYLPSGSLEHYGDPRHSSCRSRSGFDSPQSTVNSQHRYMGGSSEISPCSHIQHYDPDRALTDYITRLEALQKRLGSVQSGSTVNNTTHYGIRR
ncbi:A-kinase anchor protein 9 [Pelobates fuscus]|uniref:A-kinase anchor protein 9 n=1 Tax=Pelobates fuscus TaxID=191477 RepID=UPI002FE498EB